MGLLQSGLRASPSFRVKLHRHELSSERYADGSKLNDRRGKPQVLVHVSTYRLGNPFWNSGFLSHSHTLAMGPSFFSVQRMPTTWWGYIVWLSFTQREAMFSRSPSRESQRRTGAASDFIEHDPPKLASTNLAKLKSCFASEMTFDLV